MKTERTTARNIDEYIEGYPKNVQALLRKIRLTIRKVAPHGEEAIKYQLPTLVLKGNVVHYGAFKKHIGFYPTSSGTTKFKKELSRLKWEKGSIQFPLDKPIPYGLIARITKFRAKENLQRAESKKKK